MRSLLDLSSALREQLKQHRLTQAELRTAAGVSTRTLTKVLSGLHDYKVTTLLALADRLGLELVLVPKGAATVVTTGEPIAPMVRTRVQAALDRVDQKKKPDER